LKEQKLRISKAFRKRIAVARVEAFKKAQRAQKAACSREFRKRLLAEKLEAYRKGMIIQKVASNQVCKKRVTDAYREGQQAKKIAFSKASRKRIAAARLEAYKAAQRAQKAESSRECRHLLVVTKLEAYQKGLKAQKAASDKASKRCQTQAYREGKDAVSKAARKRVAAAKLHAYGEGKQTQKAESRRELRKRIAAAKLEAYQKGQKAKEVACKKAASRREAVAYDNGMQDKKIAFSKAARRRLQAAKDKAFQEGLKAQRVASSKAARIKLSAARLEAYQSAQRAQKAADLKASRKRVEAAKQDAYEKGYLHGVSRASGSTPANRKSKRSIDSQSDPSHIQEICTKPTAASSEQAVQAPPKLKPAPSTSSIAEALLASPTPLRIRSKAPWQGSSITNSWQRMPKPPRDDADDIVLGRRPSEPLRSRADVLLWRLDVKASSSSYSADALQEYLNGGKARVGSFQLRLRQTLPPTCCEGFGDVAAAPTRKIDIVVDGKCTLSKLNQVIAQCFDPSFTALQKTKKGTTALGSHFKVSRPIETGHCKMGIICSEASAVHVGSASEFVDERCYSVAQVFRGKSASSRIDRCGPADATTQQVIFASPLLSTEVDVSLYDFLGSDFGRKPVSQIVSSSFMNVEEMQAKNLMMQVFL
jgi:hypothetical protein